MAIRAMQVQLAVPGHWPIQEQPDGATRVIVPGHEHSPDLWLTVRPLLPLPLDPRRWVQTAPLAVESDGQIARLDKTEATQTTAGFPLWLAYSQVTVRSGSGEAGSLDANVARTPIHVRVHAFYQFLEYAAEVVIVATSSARLQAHLDELVQLLKSAKPDFRGPQVVALSELWAPAQTDSGAQ